MEYEGVVRARTLREARTDRDLPWRRTQDGTWQRIACGIYLPHNEEPTDLELAAAALEYAGPRALLTGFIAARAMKLRWIPTTGGRRCWCRLTYGDDRRRW